MSACPACSRGRCETCTGYDGPITTHPDSLPLCTCSHRHRYDLSTKRCDCGQAMWPEDHRAHVAKIAKGDT